MTDQQKLTEFLARQKHMVLAVVCEDGTPWAVPVRIKEQNGISFEWESRLDALHSAAIDKNPNVAITMYEIDGDQHTGVYVKATAELVRVTGEKGWYRAVGARVWLNDESHVKREVERSDYA